MNTFLFGPSSRARRLPRATGGIHLSSAHRGFLSSKPSLTGRRIGLLSLCLFFFVSPLVAQQTTYPAPRLTVVDPPGGRQGTEVEVAVIGVDLDGAADLYFSHPGLKGKRLPGPKADEKDPKKKPAAAESIRFLISIAPDAPPGTHDVRVIGKWGISNPRAFAVAELPEIQEKEKNDDVPEAQRVSLSSIINGEIGNKVDVDYFSFVGRMGQTVVVHCAASGIDSRLTAYLQLFGPAGKELAANKHYRDRDAKVAAVLPEDGQYLIRLSDFAYQGGSPEHFYRLTVTDGPWIDAVFPPALEPGKVTELTFYGNNLPGGKPARLGSFDEAKSTVKAPGAAASQLDFRGRLLPRLASIDGFGHRFGASNSCFLTFAEDQLVLDNEKNDTAELAQSIRVPCVVCGRIEKRDQYDYYTFEAKKGEIYYLEGFADRLRAPVDLFFQLRKVGDDKLLGLFDDHPGLPVSFDRFYTYTDDPLAKFVVPEDARYELIVRSRTADVRGGPPPAYKVNIRKPRPDFRLVLVGNHENGAGLTLRRGSSHDIEVVCLRQDEFKGEVVLTVSGLPKGVTCPPQVVGPGITQTVLVLTAAPDASDSTGPISVTGSAVIDGRTVVREARSGCLVYPSATPTTPAVSRLSRSVCLAVRDKGPFRLDTTVNEAAVPLGGPASFQIKVGRLMPDFKDTVQIVAAAGPPQPNGKVINFPKLGVAPDKEGVVKVTIPTNVPPGVYNLVFRGSGKINVLDEKKKKNNLTFVAVTPPIRLTVFDSVVELVLDPKVTLKPGSEFPVSVKVNRLHGYKGEFKLELIGPAGGKGISAADLSIPGGASEGKLLLKAAKDTKPGRLSGYMVRATAKFEAVSLKEDATLDLAIAASGVGSAPLTEYKAVKLLEEGAKGWRYTLRETVKGNTWRDPDFDDKAWNSGRAPLGNGEDEIEKRMGTLVPERGASLLCRHVVDVPPALLNEKSVSFQLLVAADDGATVFVNGQPVDDDKEDHEFSYWNREVTIPAKLLRAGPNLIAVEVNNGSDSSDVYLDLSLLARVPLKK